MKFMFEAAQITFVILKLLKIIEWSWWIVFSPTIISLGIAILYMAFFVVIKKIWFD